MTHRELITRLRAKAKARADRKAGPGKLLDSIAHAKAEQRAEARQKKKHELGQLQWFPVDYLWKRCGVEFRANTVMSGTSQRDAEDRFLRQNQHVTVIRKTK